MPFYQNPIDAEFIGPMVLGDRQYSPTWRCPGNLNKSTSMIAWNAEPYDFTIVGDRTLTFNYAFDTEFKIYSSRGINVAGATPGATLASEVVEALNDDPGFASFFTASAKNLIDGTVNPPQTVYITNNRPAMSVRAYISNSGAEQFLRFNKRAGVSELPSYFSRHTIANINNFEDCVGMLVELDETDPIDQAIIEDAGFTPGDVQEDWQLLEGQSGIFLFTYNVYDVSNRLESSIQFSAGAKEGDLAKLTQYQYDAMSSRITIQTEVPYILTSSDISTITPP